MLAPRATPPTDKPTLYRELGRELSGRLYGERNPNAKAANK
jgi:hypothetical protein